jgi:hypothetical protein
VLVAVGRLALVEIEGSREVFPLETSRPDFIEIFDGEVNETRRSSSDLSLK